MERIASEQLLNVYLPLDRRLALALGQRIPEYDLGAALYADVSGFTALGEALKTALGSRRGAEELGLYINHVYDTLVAEVGYYGGSIISFSGDAITCWFSDAILHTSATAQSAASSPVAAVQRAAACALAQQNAIAALDAFDVPGQGAFSIRLKIGVAAGRVRRFVVGDPQLQRFDVAAGATLGRMALGERLAASGEVLLDKVAVAQLADLALLGSPRRDGAAGDVFYPLLDLQNLEATRAVLPHPWPEPPAPLEPSKLRPWLLPEVFERLNAGMGEFLTELRPAVVLFLRFGGIDYDSDPQAGTKLDAFVRWVQGVLHRYEGTFFRLLLGEKGSYLYAAFGVLHAHEDDPQRAANAALELHELPSDLAYITHLQIGLSQGTVRCGAYGGRSHRTYGVLGDEVNLAARLMQSAAQGEILVTERLRLTLGRAYEWRNLPPVQLRGRRQPVPVAALLGHLAGEVPGAVFAGRLVGRRQELEQLTNWLSPIFGSDHRFAGLVYIYGEPGIGKSRLAFELRRLLSARTDSPQRVQWFEFQAEQILGQSLYAIKRFLAIYFRQDPSSPPAENQVRFQTAFDQLLTSLDETAQAELRNQLERGRSILGALVDLSWPGSLYEQLEPRLRFENTLDAFRSLLQAESLCCPVVLHFEDAHWLDSDTLALLRALTRRAETFPFAILLTGRPADDGTLFKAPVDPGVPEHILHLGELPPKSASRLALQVLEACDPCQTPGQPPLKALDARLEQFLAEKTNGNPLFLEQLVMDLFERGQIEAVKGTWCMHPSGLNEVPASINAELITRLDRLDANVRHVVQTAAVLGREFEVPVLQRMLPAEANLPLALSLGLVEAIWLPLNTPRYAFRHSLMRDAAYEMQPTARLQEMHSLAANAIEQEHSADLPAYYADLAYHYAAANQPANAFHYACRAGKRAATQFANQQAIALYQSALGYADQLDESETLPNRQAAHAALGELLITTGQYDRAEAHLTDALTLAQQMSSPVAQAQACHWIARLQENLGNFSAALEWVHSGLEILDEQISVPTAEMFNTAGLVHSRLGNYADALYYGQRCLQVANSLGTTATIGRAYNLLGHVHRLLGDNATALAYFQRSLELYRQAGDIKGQGLAQNQVANAAADLGRWDEAVRDYVRAREVFSQIGDVYNRSFVDNNLGLISLTQGNLDDALASFQAGLHTIEQYGGSAYVLGAFHSNLASVYLRRGEVATANQHLDTSQALFDSAEVRDWLPELYRHRSTAALLAGDPASAQALAQQSLDLAREMNMRAEEGIALRALGEALTALGELTQAAETLHSSLAILQELDNTYEHALALVALGNVFRALGDLPAAQDAFEQSVPAFERLGANLDLKRLRSLNGKES
ncbi:MAG: tetratricopeptide repeat protein [Chloroflexota bacterium]